MLFCGRFRKILSYKSENTSAQFFSINSSFIGIDRSMSVHAYLVKKYDRDFLKKVKNGRIL